MTFVLTDVQSAASIHVQMTNVLQVCPSYDADVQLSSLRLSNQFGMCVGLNIVKVVDLSSVFLVK
jgi:hypothetical protein